MKKLWGGIFRQNAQQSTPKKRESIPPTRASSSGGNDRRAHTPTPEPSAYSKTGPRSSWDYFFTSPSAPRPPTSPPLPVIQTSEQVFNQNLDILMRESILKIKVVITKMIENVDFHEDLGQLSGFITLAADRLQQNGEPSAVVLKNYFASPAGSHLCEQTAFPSLALDFLDKVRVFLLKEELKAMGESAASQRTQDNAESGREDANAKPPDSGTVLRETGVSSDMERSIGFLMGCVQAIASNSSLIENFRCEIPNLIYLTAEQYPPSAMFLRDLSIQALAAVSDKNFNAGLVWYLHDCNIVAKTVKMISSYTMARLTTPENAAAALQAIMPLSPLVNASAGIFGSTDHAATAAAVSDALGFNKSNSGYYDSSVEVSSAFEVPAENATGTEESAEPVSKLEEFCFESYDALLGIKSLVYVLQKTCRHSLVLLGEFQSSGGYSLLARLLKTRPESDVSTLIYLFTLLLPLGAGFSGACGGDENMATVMTCGARNVGAFLAMRDLLIKSISELEILTDGQLTDAMRLRNEQLILQLLTTILHVYTSDYDNFLCLEPKTQALALILTKLPWIAFYDAKVIVLRIVEYVCAAAKPENPLPTELLSILCSLFVEYTTSETARLLEIPIIDAIHEVSEMSEERSNLATSAARNNGLSQLGNSTNNVTESAQDDEAVVENHSLSLLLCSCIVKILQNSNLPAYSEVLNGFGLLERGIYIFFVKVSNSLAALAGVDEDLRRNYISRINLHLSMWSSLAAVMLRKNLQVCIEFRELRVHQSLYAIADALISYDMMDKIQRPQEFRSCFSALSVFSVFIELSNFRTSQKPEYMDENETLDFKARFDVLQAGVESDLRKVLELVQGFRGCIQQQRVLLDVLKQMLQGKNFVWGPWRSCQGHETLISILSSLESMEEDTDDKQFQLMDLILAILSDILDPVNGDEGNRQYFKTEVGYPAIASCLVNSGVLKTDKLPSVLNRIFELITGVSSPRNKIRNADAVHTLFCLIPRVETETAEASLDRLMLKLTSNDEIAFSRKKQTAILVKAGAFKWLADPEIVPLYVEDNPLKAPLTRLIMVLSKEELSTSHLREFLRVVAMGMPLLLANQYHPRIKPTSEISASNEVSRVSEEVGLLLLKQAFEGSHVPHVSVGTSVKTRMTAGYIHIVNSLDRLWPPSSGYSFACWLRFPPVTTNTLSNTSPSDAIPKLSSDGSTVSVALCEGYITVALHGDDIENTECYCVLVGATLTFFPSNEMAIRNENSTNTRDVTAVACNGDLDFYFWSHEKRFHAKCRSSEDTEMWLKAMQQSESISNISIRNKAAWGEMTSDDEVLFVSSGSNPASDAEPNDGLEGYACILSVYSLESAGCFVRIYFEQATGCLRVDTGLVSSASNMNPSSKRNSAVFKNIDMNLLRASPSPSGLCDETSTDSTYAKEEDDGSHWHHVAFTHRKSVVGSSLLTLYIDGSEVTTKKLSYPSAPTMGSMQAFVGKDIQVCGTYPALPWSIGPSWFTEEALSANAIVCMFLLGPSFSGQFSGHAYRSAGDWPEAYASSQLDRATQRRVDIVRVAKRLQLTKLGRASRRVWGESGGFASATSDIASDLVGAKKDDAGDVFRFPSSGAGGSSRKEQQRIEAFQSFIKYDCAMSSFGNEILGLLSSFKLSEDLVLFSLNTTCSAQSKIPVILHTQIQYVGTESLWPLDLPKVLPSVGGVTQLLLPLLENAWRPTELNIILKLLSQSMRRNPTCLSECLDMNGYALIADILSHRVHLVNEKVLKSALRFAISSNLAQYDSPNEEIDSSHPLVSSSGSLLIVDSTALSQIVLCTEIRKILPWRLQCQLVISLRDLLNPKNPNALFNARQLRRTGFLSWALLYLSELTNEDCSFEKTSTLERRWCFPEFAGEGYNELLQCLLSLLRAYFHAENHVDDVYAIAEMLLLSITNDSVHRKESSVRVVILQFLLHEIENDYGMGRKTVSPSSSANSNIESAELLSPTIVDAILLRTSSGGSTKKRKEKQGESTMHNNTASNTATPSGAANASALCSPFPVDGLDNILLEIISRTDAGPYASVEAILALRILLSLAHEYPSLAQYLFQSSPALYQKFKRVLQGYSTDPNIYIPILAYVSNISIKDTKYHDLVTNGNDRLQQYALPTPCAFLSPEKYCIDQVWELLGCLLLRNCELQQELAKTINVIVLAQLSFQAEVSEPFFTTMCNSSSTIFRIIVQCVLCQSHQPSPTDSPEHSDDRSETLPATLQQFLGCLISGRPPISLDCEIAVACFDLLKVLMSRSLFEKDGFASSMIFILECLDDGILRQQPVIKFGLADGQKCWLALLVHIVKSAKALSENCSFLVLRNICTLGIALSRYLVEECKHQGAVSGTELGSSLPESSPDSAEQTGQISRVESNNSGGITGSTNCFGTDVLIFFLSSVRMCAEPHISRVVGTEDQQFFYGCLVYCAQTVLLNELNGFHRGTTPSPRLLDCLTGSKHLLIQQTKCSSVMVCGTFTNHHSNDVVVSGSGNNAPPNPGGFSGRLNRMRSLSSNAHKEFGIGSESDRSFILSLAAELFRMLIDDSENVRHSSILTWQFLMQQRMGVLKELLIVEPRVSLLQNITTNKKEAIDVYHGGFERLLHVLPHRIDSATTIAPADTASTRESWLQFHIWLTENYDLLKDLILVRTEPIYQHLVEVLLSCVCIRRVNTNSSTLRLLAQGDLCINVDFTVYFDSEQGGKSIGVSNTDGEELLDVGYKAAARKTMFKLSNMKDSSLDAMVDSQARWQKTLMQLFHTRSIWQMGGWQIYANSEECLQYSTNGCSRAAATALTEEFFLERSIFQQNTYKYRLDFTEGPQRMRLRLMRSYELEAPDGDEKDVISSDQSLDHSTQHTSGSAADRPSATDDLFAKSREFHEAVEVFRDFLFRNQAAAMTDDNSAHILTGKELLADILSRATFARTREAFAADETSFEDDMYRSSAVARRLFNFYLSKADEHSTKSAVLEATLTDIDSLITAAETNPLENMIPSTIFDVADSEFMHAPISSVKPALPADTAITRVQSPTSAPTIDSDDDEEDDLPVAPLGKALVAADDEDSDEEDLDEEGSERSGSKQDTARDPSGLLTENNTVGVEEEASSTAFATEKTEQDHEDKIFDSSFDYIYGGIARFLQRDDYPPLKCYNAIYVAGMAKIEGIFLICRTSFYFIGEYGKHYHVVDVESGTTGGAPSNPLSPGGAGSSGSNHSPISPGKMSAAGDKGAGGAAPGKKKTKDLIRDRLADISNQFSQSKSTSNQLFTVVPLTTPDQVTASVTDASSNLTTSKRWSIKYANVKQFSRIKYQLRPVGIEFFDLFGSTFFLQFESQSEREEIIKLIFQMPIVNSIFWNPLLRSSALSLSVKRIRQALTKRWLRGTISNFEYLMHLNTLAGRSFNDITQYPVFPWIIADYKSDFLDLDDKATFRDLSKPMGALGESRALQFRERYNAMNEVGPGPFDSPAFHYGTHYSCSAYVVNYLIRLEPFTKLAVELQGGCFDHADRLFCNIPSSWKSASTDNLQDVRELIPEFFYLPEFLYNSNNYDFGTTQSGDVVSHVRLPPWAHGDPREFIRIHRRALESRYVSENLHHWIDLIFGVKQTGQAALDAQNVFMHITYEGTVDIDQIEDPVMRNAMLSQIENFGQTPSRIFSSPHPQRKVPTLLSSSALATPAVGHQYEGNTLSSIEAYVKWHTPLAPALVAIGKDYAFLKKTLTAKVIDDAIGDVKLVNDKFICRSIGCSFVPPRFTKYADWGSVDGTIKFRVHQSSARNREVNKVIGVIEGAHHCSVNCATFSDDGLVFVTGGQDGVVNVLECLKLNGQRVFKQLAKLVGHEDAVVSVAINKEFNLIASGSTDCCVVLWDLRTRVFLRELMGHSAPVTKVAINSANGNVLTLTSTEIRIWSINGDLLAVANTQAFGLTSVTSAISTRCEMWQNGVVAVTGHSNGTIALWGISYPSDIEQEKRNRLEAATDSGTSTSPSGLKVPVAPSSSRAGGTRTPVRIGKHNASFGSSEIPASHGADQAAEHPRSALKAVPSCQLFIMKLLLDHRASVTALTLGVDQRQLLSGDAEGNCIRWVDDSISTNIM